MNINPIEFKPLNKLLLDEDNPRLPSNIQKRSQNEMLAYIARKGGIEDLMSAIGENDFFAGEALVVYRNKNDPTGTYRVIEGNRRLTAVKLLSNPGLCPRRPSIAELAKGAKYKPTELPVIVMPDRAGVLPYLGSRHIVGVRQWDPLAKARYMEQLLTDITDKKTPIQQRYRTIAESIGSHKRTDYIKNNLDALAVYKVIEENDFYEITGLTEETIDFGTLYTALVYEPIGAYAGVVKKKVTRDKTIRFEEVDPILDQKLINKKNVANLVKWFYEKNENGETILGESRNLAKLAHVLNSPAALANLERGATLDDAYSESQGITDEFIAHLQKAKNYLRSASSLMANIYADKECIKLSDELFELAKTIKTIVHSKSLDND